MIESPDYDINNYSINELKIILDINDSYDNYELENKFKNKLNLCLENNVDKTTIDFLYKVKSILSKSLDLNNDNDLYNRVSVVNNHSVIEKNTSSFENIISTTSRLNPIEVFPTDISRSNLNVIKRKTTKTSLVFNTKFMNQSDYKCDFLNEYLFTLPIMFKNVFSLRLSSVQLPNVFYTFRSIKKNNTFYIKEYTTNIKGLITIDDGNYSSDEIGDYLTDLINHTLHTDDRFSVSLNHFTGKLTFINTTNNFTIIFGNYNSDNINCDFNTIDNCECSHNNNNNDNDNLNDQFFINNNTNSGYILGFCKNFYTNNNIYIGETLYNPNISNYVYFCLNDFNKSQYNSVIGILNDSLIDNNVLGIVPLTSNYFTYNFDNGSDYIQKKRDYFGPINLVKISVKLLNEEGEPLNLIGQHFSFTLELEIAYDW